MTHLNVMTQERSVKLRQKIKAKSAGDPPVRRHLYKRLSQYGGRCEWLRDDKFLRDLEGDSVDTEILDEELRSLQDDDTETCRGKTVKFLESNIFQVVLCAVVFIDALVVVAQILLDLHAVRGQYNDAEQDLQKTLGFIRVNFAEELADYDGSDVDYIMKVLEYNLGNVTDNSDASLRKRRSVPFGFPVSATDVAQNFKNPSNQDFPKKGSNRHNSGVSLNTNERVDIQTTGKTITYRGNRREVKETPHRSADVTLDIASRHHADSVLSRNKRTLQEDQHVSTSDEKLFTLDPGAPDTTAESSPASDQYPYPPKKKKKKSTYDKLLKIAHILHYISIAILGLFVIQIFLIVYSMGVNFFKSKLEVFDAMIILASFILDLIFVEGISGYEGEEALALLVLFLLWRLLRVINGIMVTTKKRQEFRIRLQRRARRRAEKRIDVLDEDKQFRDKEITALKELCQEKGATQDEIQHCKPKRKTIFHKMDTSTGLSSIASLSLGLSMSMSGGSTAMLNRVPQPTLPPPKSRRQSIQEALSLKSRRSQSTTSRPNDIFRSRNASEGPSPAVRKKESKPPMIGKVEEEVPAEESVVSNNVHDSNSLAQNGPVSAMVHEQAQDSITPSDVADNSASRASDENDNFQQHNATDGSCQPRKVQFVLCTHSSCDEDSSTAKALLPEVIFTSDAENETSVNSCDLVGSCEQEIERNQIQQNGGINSNSNTDPDTNLTEHLVTERPRSAKSLPSPNMRHRSWSYELRPKIQNKPVTRRRSMEEKTTQSEHIIDVDSSNL